MCWSCPWLLLFSLCLFFSWPDSLDCLFYSLVVFVLFAVNTWWMGITKFKKCWSSALCRILQPAGRGRQALPLPFTPCVFPDEDPPRDSPIRFCSHRSLGFRGNRAASIGGLEWLELTCMSHTWFGKTLGCGSLLGESSSAFPSCLWFGGFPGGQTLSPPWTDRRAPDALCSCLSFTILMATLESVGRSRWD